MQTEVARLVPCGGTNIDFTRVLALTGFDLRFNRAISFIDNDVFVVTSSILRSVDHRLSRSEMLIGIGVHVCVVICVSICVSLWAVEFVLFFLKKYWYIYSSPVCEDDFFFEVGEL